MLAGMIPTPNRGSFPARFWQEAEPLVIHIGVVLLLEISLLLIGLAALGLEKLFPNHRESFNLIEQIDIWLALALLCLFGLFTLIRIIIRLVFGIAEEVRLGSRGDESSVESLSEMSDDSTDREKDK
jgi:hypothetical protein